MARDWLRIGVPLGYAALLGVNGIFGSGAFGVPTNADISGAYPSPVTPAGFTFAIWGPIFALQGGGTWLVASGGAPALGEAVGVPWLATWFFECAWQLVFAQLPLPASSGSPSTRLGLLVPAAGLLLAAEASMLWAAKRVVASASAATASERALLAVPTAINAAWLGAAAGIGVSLVAKELGSPLGGPAGGAALLAAVVALAHVVLLWSVASCRPFAVAHAAATCWACFGMTKGDAPDEVKTVATYGGAILAAVAVVACLATPREKPPPSAAVSADAAKAKAAMT